MPESVKVFLSTASDEFRAYRDQLRSDLTRHNVEVKAQEDFKDLGGGISMNSTSISRSAIASCISSAT